MRDVVECADLLAQCVDLAGPASLVRFLAVFGEAGTFKGCRELGLQLGDIVGEDDSAVGRATSEAARKFLRGTLGVRPADPVEIITQHILPVFEGSDRGAVIEHRLQRVAQRQGRPGGAVVADGELDDVDAGRG